MDDIVQQLKMKAVEVEWDLPIMVSGLMEQAAAEIERLRAEVAALKHEIDGWRQWDDVDPQIKGECLREARERRIATDAARKENNGNA